MHPCHALAAEKLVRKHGSFWELLEGLAGGGFVAEAPVATGRVALLAPRALAPVQNTCFMPLERLAGMS